MKVHQARQACQGSESLVSAWRRKAGLAVALLTTCCLVWEAECAVSIDVRLLSESNENVQTGMLSPIVANAFLEVDGDGGPCSTCFLPYAFWKRNWPQLEPTDDNALDLRVRRCRVAELSEVVVGVHDGEAYNFVRNGMREFVDALLLSKCILRLGFQYAVTAGHVEMAFTVLAAEPVSQALVGRATNILVVKHHLLRDDGSVCQARISEPSSITTTIKDDLDFSSDFILRSTLGFGHMSLTANMHFPLYANVRTGLQPDRTTADAKSVVAKSPERSRLTLHAVVLSKPFPLLRLVPKPAEHVDPHSLILVPLRTLAQLGVVSGDWVSVGLVGQCSSRPCRAYAMTTLSSSSVEHDEALITPLLAHNLGYRPSTVARNAPLTVHVCSAEQQFAPPVAVSVTLARVASVLASDRRILPAMYDGLHHWFSEADRIIAIGDVVPAVLDVDEAILRPRQKGVDDTFAALENCRDLFVSNRRHKSLVYFQVTRIEMGRKGKEAGHCACRLSPTHTEVRQISVVHARSPPGAARYLGTADRLPPPCSLPGSAEVYRIVASGLHPRAGSLGIRCITLLKGPRGVGKRTMVLSVADSLGLHVVDVNAYDLVAESDAKTAEAVMEAFNKSKECAPCAFLLRNIEALVKKDRETEIGKSPFIATVLKESLKQVDDAQKVGGHPIAVIAATSEPETIPNDVLGIFRHDFVIEPPDESARREILQNLTEYTPLAPDVSLNHVAAHTAALVAKDLVDLVARAEVAAGERVLRCSMASSDSAKRLCDVDLISAGVTMTAADFENAIEMARESYSDSIGAPKIPTVTWDDVGGLASVKSDILDTIQLPLDHPEMFTSGLRKRSGLLLYGPPGTGKTLLAKAVATSCSLNFFSVKGPELLNMYIGESEANVRRVFQRARSARPCVVFFDELDSIAPKRGQQGDSGGVMDRIVSQLLAELDGMSGAGSGGGDVFVIGATNRPDLLDSALLRPGRFDKLIYLGVCEDHESQLKIIQALTRKFRLHPSLDLTKIADQCPFHYTGADFYALCSDAMLKAMSRVAGQVADKVSKLNETGDCRGGSVITVPYFLDRMATEEDMRVEVTEEDFAAALRDLTPSVSAEELERFKSIKEKFSAIAAGSNEEPQAGQASTGDRKGKGRADT